MRGRVRLPTLAMAIALLGLIAMLATLQYKWLGRISDAERDRMRASLNTRAAGFAQDFDAELTRAFLLFQLESHTAGTAAGRLAVRYDRWQATARYPGLIKDVYVAGADSLLQRYDPATRVLDPVVWPAALEPIRARLMSRPDPASPADAFFVRALPPVVWENVPALLIPSPMFLFNQPVPDQRPHLSSGISFTVLLIDRDYVTNEMLPALAQQYFRQTGDGFDYQLAVVSTADGSQVYRSTRDGAPRPDVRSDAAVDLFEVRTQEFAPIVAEVRRFTSTITTTGQTETGSFTTYREQIVVPPSSGAPAGASGDFAVIVKQNGSGGTAAIAGTPALGSAHWRLLVTHPSGSLEGAVNAARRRNLIVSTSILAVLGASIGLLVISTRRAQELARRQLEFVASVSHELRTPLAVIRSAGENLADGVVREEDQVRKYGDLVKNEGRRLTDMVEQILEFAGIESGQRGFALRPVAIAPMLHDIVESSAALIEKARIEVEYALPDRLPPVLGDEAALRRVFQNLIGNAIKYGERGGWIGISAGQTDREVSITIADRGLGIAPAEQPRIFDPFYRAPEVVEAQIQGAGLGLSLVRRIVEAHGGRVAVQSSPGVGSQFIVALPIAREEPVERAALSEPHGSRA
jgi:signal transduction histidine kinase